MKFIASLLIAYAAATESVGYGRGYAQPQQYAQQSYGAPCKGGDCYGAGRQLGGSSGYGATGYGSSQQLGGYASQGLSGYGGFQPDFNVPSKAQGFGAPDLSGIRGLSGSQGLKGFDIGKGLGELDINLSKGINGIGGFGVPSFEAGGYRDFGDIKGISQLDYNEGGRAKDLGNIQGQKGFQDRDTEFGGLNGLNGIEGQNQSGHKCYTSKCTSGPYGTHESDGIISDHDCKYCGGRDCDWCKQNGWYGQGSKNVGKADSFKSHDIGEGGLRRGLQHSNYAGYGGGYNDPTYGSGAFIGKQTTNRYDGYSSERTQNPARYNRYDSNRDFYQANGINKYDSYSSERTQNPARYDRYDSGRDGYGVQGISKYDTYQSERTQNPARYDRYDSGRDGFGVQGVSKYDTYQSERTQNPARYGRYDSGRLSPGASISPAGAGASFGGYRGYGY